MNAFFKLALGAAALALVGVQACSSEEPAAPSRPPIPPPIVDQGDGGASDAGGDAGDCFDTTKAKPTQPTHFLNQCNGGECFPFDNGTRIEGWKPGAPLPPLT
ncbi:MAG: hypothetical protein KF819_21000 [Labilithrix sp.]|nr:hypothetical protein [Labilithrix sp.]